MLTKSTFKYTVRGRFWITLNGTMDTADGLASSMLILRILLDPESRTGQPRNMRRSSETMAWKALCKEGNWEMAFTHRSRCCLKDRRLLWLCCLREPQVLFSMICDYKTWILGMLSVFY